MLGSDAFTLTSVVSMKRNNERISIDALQLFSLLSLNYLTSHPDPNPHPDACPHPNPELMLHAIVLMSKPVLGPF